MTQSILDGTTPVSWGMPAKFPQWNPTQPKIIEDIWNCSTDISAHCAPTGSGKSLAAVGASSIAKARTCIITSTKVLQDQYDADFSDVGLTVIKGKNNYSCFDKGGLTCEEAWPVCRAKGHNECPYKGAKDAACKAPLVVTNYSCWLHQSRFGAAFTKADPDDEPMPFDNLVLDEAHEAPEALANYVAVDLTLEDMTRFLKAAIPPRDQPMTDWKAYANVFLPRVKSQVQEVDSAIRVGMKLDDQLLKDHVRLSQILMKLETLAKCNPDMWVVEPSKHGFNFDPIWPGNYAKLLFQNIPRAMLFSATLRPKTMYLLGLKDEQFTFYEYPSTFNPNDCPIIHVPTVRMRHDTSPDDLRMLYTRIDQVIGARLDRKGIIHSVSYPRATEIMRNSEYRDFMLANARYGMGISTEDAIKRFKDARPPTAFVSPSIATGCDFPGRQCEYNIVPKIPFVDSRSILMQERCKRDPEYSNYITAQTLTQMCGRGNRFEGDRCQTFILDDSIGWFKSRNARLFPKYFSSFYRVSGALPTPLAKM